MILFLFFIHSVLTAMKGMKRAFIKSENLATILEENEPMIKKQRTNDPTDQTQSSLIKTEELLTDTTKSALENSNNPEGSVESDIMMVDEQFDLATFCRMALLL